MNFYKLNLKPVSEAPYSSEIIEAYKKVLSTSDKYDVENKTAYGKRVMKLAYDKLTDLCKSAGLKTMSVCSDLAGYDI